MTRWLGVILLVLGPLVGIAVCVVIVASLAALGDPSPRLLQAQLDSANTQLDIARWQVNHLNSTLPQVAAACQRRRSVTSPIAAAAGGRTSPAPRRRP